MKVKQVTVSFSGTIPTQQYGNVSVSGEWVAELDESDSPEQVTQELFANVRDQITEAVRPIAQAKQRQIDAVMSMLTPEQQKEFKAKMGVFQWLETVIPEAQLAAPSTTLQAVDKPAPFNFASGKDRRIK